MTYFMFLKGYSSDGKGNRGAWKVEARVPVGRTTEVEIVLSRKDGVNM